MLELADRHREVVAARRIQREWKSHQRHKQDKQYVGQKYLLRVLFHFQPTAYSNMLSAK